MGVVRCLGADSRHSYSPPAAGAGGRGAGGRGAGGQGGYRTIARKGNHARHFRHFNTSTPSTEHLDLSKRQPSTRSPPPHPARLTMQPSLALLARSVWKGEDQHLYTTHSNELTL